MRTDPRASPRGSPTATTTLRTCCTATTVPEVAAIVDWEMCTVGDPLLDLGWLLATWPSERDPGIGGALAALGGLPTRDELVARYTERSTRDLSAVAWYEVMASFKLGIVLEGTHARAFAGKAPVEVGDLLHATTLVLFSPRARPHEGCVT